MRNYAGNAEVTLIKRRLQSRHAALRMKFGTVNQAYYRAESKLTHESFTVKRTGQRSDPVYPIHTRLAILPVTRSRL